MAITAADVKKLREMTGAGMMDCKKALTETDGDFDAAVDFLRKKGLATAEKKAGRIAAEGIVATVVSDDDKTATIIEVNSETDFVAKNEKFQTYVNGLATQINSGDYADMAAFLASTSAIEGSATVEDYHKSMIATIGENLTIRRFEKTTGDVVVSYIHMGGKIGVLVNAECDNANDSVKEAMKNIAMQIAAMNPSYVKRDEISADQLKKEKDIIIDSSLADPASLPKPLLNALFDEAISNKVAAYAEDGNLEYQAEAVQDFVASEDVSAAEEYPDLEETIAAGLSDDADIEYVDIETEDFTASDENVLSPEELLDFTVEEDAGLEEDGIIDDKAAVDAEETEEDRMLLYV